MSFPKNGGKAGNGNGKNGSNVNTTPANIRCGIYTRKSTEEGLEQDFNSLDAQREACEAYIASQKNEGWQSLPERYDDGGFTGANIERPALQRLIADIKTSKIDCVVTYKIDRLSRSLLDFAKLMDLFEQHNVALVSVTQQFSSANSMGRLTLNILMSFAEFERQMIAERTRDKMSAARKRGKWLGGTPVLGYTVETKPLRKLVIIPEEATIIREIFRLYLDYQSLMHVADEINDRGWRSKLWVTKTGKKQGGKKFDKNYLSRILTNVTYIGQVDFKGEIYDGEHEAIIDTDTFQKVQHILECNYRSHSAEHRNQHGALLKGLLYCSHCNRSMTHTFTNKKAKRYRYYTCTVAQKRGVKHCPTRSISAEEIENFVVSQIQNVGKNPEVTLESFNQANIQMESQKSSLTTEKSMLADSIRKSNEEARRLVMSISESDSPAAHISEKLKEIEEQIQQLEHREKEIQSSITTLQSSVVKEDDFRNAMELFMPIWEVLFPREKIRIINHLIERVEYNGATGKLNIKYSATGIRLLALEYRKGK